MDFIAEKKSIGGLLSSKKQFRIPRFQREYSWGTRELKEFYEDIVSRIKLSDDKLDTTEYFFWSILLIGDLNDAKKSDMEIVDGQQRLTTITIFLSALAKKLFNVEETQLADKVWDYIISKDNNLNLYAILVNETPKPFFQFLVQERKDYKELPKNTEEENILNAFKYFSDLLSENKLKKQLNKLTEKEFANIDYVELLKAVRDQLLRSVLVCICTNDIKYANMIFEILNAKGKSLASIDLIKNSIFEILSKEVPADEAKEKWKKIRDNLTSRELMIDFSTFYRHFWISKYSKVSDNKLYSAFLSKIPKKEEAYLMFLDELVRSSELYVKVLKPSIEIDFSNHKHYQTLIDSCKAINTKFNVVQSRLLMLTMFDLHLNKDILTCAQLIDTVKYIENFHFAYNAICSKRTSKLEKPYSQLSISLYAAKSKDEVSKCLSLIRQTFNTLLPAKEEFVASFKKLKYSKERLPSNILSQYAIYKIEDCLATRCVDKTILSIEHIEDESSEFSLSIGNLCALETVINNKIPVGLDISKKVEHYLNSNSMTINNFIEGLNGDITWNNKRIETRAEYLASFYYDKIIKN